MSTKLNNEQLFMSICALAYPVQMKRQFHTLSCESLRNYYIGCESVESVFQKVKEKAIELIKRVIELITKGIDKLTDFCQRIQKLNKENATYTDEDKRIISTLTNVVANVVGSENKAVSSTILEEPIAKLLKVAKDDKDVIEKSEAVTRRIDKLINPISERNNGLFFFISYPPEKLMKDAYAVLTLIKENAFDKLEETLKKIFPVLEWDEKNGPVDGLLTCYKFMNYVTKVRFDDECPDALYWQTRKEFIERKGLFNIDLAINYYAKSAAKDLKTLQSAYKSVPASTLEKLPTSAMKSFQMISTLVSMYITSMINGLTFSSELRKAVETIKRKPKDADKH